MKVEKYISNEGTVAVLYSPGYGAGWSTWNDDEKIEFLTSDKTLIEMVLREASTEEVETYLKTVFGDKRIFTGGWCQMMVAWLPKNTLYQITEYDGFESLETMDDIDWSKT